MESNSSTAHLVYRRLINDASPCILYLCLFQPTLLNYTNSGFYHRHGNFPSFSHGLLINATSNMQEYNILGFLVTPTLNKTGIVNEATHEVTRIVAQPNICRARLVQEERLNVLQKLLHRLHISLEIPGGVIGIAPEMFAARQVLEIAREFLVLVEKLIVVVTAGLRFDLVVVGVARAHVQDKINSLACVGSEGLGDVCAHIVVCGSDSRLVYDEVDEVEAGGWAV